MKPVFEKTYWETPFSCERDSLTIRGKAMIPKKQTADKLTPVIVSHGFMANMQTTAGYCRKLASWGFAAFCFDFAGGCIKGSSDGKTTEMSVFTEAEAMEQAKAILIKHFGGYTIQEASGGWIDGDTVYQEYTLVIYLSDTTADRVHAAADELVNTFRQSSVMIQENPTVTEFYSPAQ